MDNKEGWVLKNWYFGTVVLEKTLFFFNFILFLNFFFNLILFLFIFFNFILFLNFT